MLFHLVLCSDSYHSSFPLLLFFFQATIAGLNLLTGTLKLNGSVGRALWLVVLVVVVVVVAAALLLVTISQWLPSTDLLLQECNGHESR